MTLDKPESVGDLAEGVPGHYLVQADVVIVALLVGEGGAAVGGVDGHPRVFTQNDVISVRARERGSAAGQGYGGDTQSYMYCK